MDSCSRNLRLRNIFGIILIVFLLFQQVQNIFAANSTQTLKIEEFKIETREKNNIVKNGEDFTLSIKFKGKKINPNDSLILGWDSDFIKIQGKSFEIKDKDENSVNNDSIGKINVTAQDKQAKITFSDLKTEYENFEGEINLHVEKIEFSGEIDDTVNFTLKLMENNLEKESIQQQVRLCNETVSENNEIRKKEKIYYITGRCDAKYPDKIQWGIIFNNDRLYVEDGLMYCTCYIPKDMEIDNDSIYFRFIDQNSIDCFEKNKLTRYDIRYNSEACLEYPAEYPANFPGYSPGSGQKINYQVNGDSITVKGIDYYPIIWLNSNYGEDDYYKKDDHYKKMYVIVNKKYLNNRLLEIFFKTSKGENKEYTVKVEFNENGQILKKEYTVRPYEMYIDGSCIAEKNKLENHAQINDKKSGNLEKIEDLEKKNKELKKKIIDLNNKIKELKEKTEECNKCQIPENSDKGSQIDQESHKKEIEDLKKEIEDLKGKNEGLNKQIEDLEEKSKVLEEKSKDLEEKSKDLEEKSKDLEGKSKVLEEKSKVLEEKSKGLEEKSKGLEEKSKGLNKQIEDLEEKSKDLEGKNIDLNNQIKELKKKTEECNKCQIPEKKDKGSQTENKDSEKSVTETGSQTDSENSTTETGSQTNPENSTTETGSQTDSENSTTETGSQTDSKNSDKEIQTENKEPENSTTETGSQTDSENSDKEIQTENKDSENSTTETESQTDSEKSEEGSQRENKDSENSTIETGSQTDSEKSEEGSQTENKKPENSEKDKSKIETDKKHHTEIEIKDNVSGGIAIRPKVNDKSDKEDGSKNEISQNQHESDFENNKENDNSTETKKSDSENSASSSNDYFIDNTRKEVKNYLTIVRIEIEKEGNSDNIKKSNQDIEKENNLVKTFVENKIQDNFIQNNDQNDSSIFTTDLDYVNDEIEEQDDFNSENLIYEKSNFPNQMTFINNEIEEKSDKQNSKNNKKIIEKAKLNMIDYKVKNNFYSLDEKTLPKTSTNDNCKKTGEAFVVFYILSRVLDRRKKKGM